MFFEAHLQKYITGFSQDCWKRQALFLNLFCRWGNWDSKRWNNLALVLYLNQDSQFGLLMPSPCTFTISSVLSFQLHLHQYTNVDHRALPKINARTGGGGNAGSLHTSWFSLKTKEVLTSFSEITDTLPNPIARARKLKTCWVTVLFLRGSFLGNSWNCVVWSANMYPNFFQYVHSYLKGLGNTHYS